MIYLLDWVDLTQNFEFKNLKNLTYVDCFRVIKTENAIKNVKHREYSLLVLKNSSDIEKKSLNSIEKHKFLQFLRPFY
jgi:hypothetical protein